MTDNSQNNDSGDHQEQPLTFDPLSTAVEKFHANGKPLDMKDLFQKFLSLPAEERIQCVNALLLAKCIAEKPGATIMVEFMRELGRNLRALLVVEKGSGGQSDDTPWG